jgi:hypothetical protein
LQDHRTAWIGKSMAGQTYEHRHEKRLVRALIIPTVIYGSETRKERLTHVKCGYGGRC